MDYPRDKLARDFFCDTRFNSFSTFIKMLSTNIL